MTRTVTPLLALAFLGLASLSSASEFPDAFFANYCFECHDGLTQKGEIRLDDAVDREWGSAESRSFFERVLDMLAADEMPPKKEKNQPTSAERETVQAYLHEQLLAHSETGGTVLRRLNQTEYKNTIEELFGFDFELPPGFPADSPGHGFDNVGEDLVLSPPLMESYFNAAVAVADELFPPPPAPVPSSTFRSAPKEMVISYSSGVVIDGAMRLAQKTPNVIRSCTWPAKFEAKASARYRLSVQVSAFGAEKAPEPLKLQIYAKKISDSNNSDPRKERLLAEYEISSATPEVLEFEAELYRGETPIFFYANGPLDETKKKELEIFLRTRFKKNPRLLAAWQAVKHDRGLRGGVGWERVKEQMANKNLDLSNATLDSPETDKLIDTMLKQTRQYVESISYQIFEEGPAIGVHEITIEGPLERVEDNEDRRRQKLRDRFLGSHFTKLNSNEQIPTILQRFLSAAFRRPATEAEVEGYTELVTNHLDAGHSFEEGIHLAIRTALVSPDFLYRESKPGQLNDFDLASRLSYFLTSHPPDDQLRKRSEAGELSDPESLARETLRLLKTDGSKTFVSSFTSQWLGTRHLADIMPDQRLIDFKSADRYAMIRETELFFTEILEKNLPVRTFIDPGFTFMNKDLAAKIYEHKGMKSKNMQRVALPAGSPYGGILGQAGVMMATANGVDTQPVLRGVWVLENVLGDPPPPPPTNVPAITPDTRGTKTVRDLMAAHTSEESCAGCHQKIDPLGFVLENFDPVGRWRTHYPVYDEKNKPRNGPAVDASGAMPDGAEFKDVNDLKAYVVENIDSFGQCLAEKLMTYATGRHLSYADRHEISQIVDRNLKNGKGFQDLLVSLVQSDVFRTK